MMHLSLRRATLIGSVVVACLAVVVTVSVFATRAGSADPGGSSAWLTLPSLPTGVPSVSTAVVAGDSVVFLGGTGADPAHRSPAPGASLDVNGDTTRQLSAPSITNGLSPSVAQPVGDQIVVVGSPCTSNAEMSSGDCFQTSWAAELYDITTDSWTALPTPVLPVQTPLTAAGAVGTTAVFAVRDTGELFGLDVATRAWSSLAPAVAPAEVAVCAMDGTPTALSNSFLVNGQETTQPPAATDIDGTTTSGAEPVRVKPTISVYENGNWQKRASFDAQSSTPFELTCGATTAYVLAHATLAQINAGSPVVSLLMVNSSNWATTAVPAAPVAIDVDGWQHKTVIENDLATISSLGGGGQRFQADTQTWLTMPPLPAAFSEVALEVIGSVNGAIVIRNRGDVSDPGGQLAALAAPENGVFE